MNQTSRLAGQRLLEGQMSIRSWRLKCEPSTRVKSSSESWLTVRRECFSHLPAPHRLTTPTSRANTAASGCLSGGKTQGSETRRLKHFSEALINAKQFFSRLNPIWQSISQSKPNSIFNHSGVSIIYSSGGCWSFKEGKLIFGLNHKNCPFIYM